MERVYDLPGQFLLLCLDPLSGKIKPGWYHFSYGLAGAILLELGIRDNITLRHSRIWPKDQRQSGDAILDDAFMAVQNSPKKKRPGQWLIRLSYRSRRYRRLIIADWEKRGLVRLSSRKYFGFWPAEEVGLRDPGVQTRLLGHVLHKVETAEALEERDVALLMLIDAGKLHAILGPEGKVKEAVKNRLDEHFARNQCASKHLGLFREIRNAIRSSLTSAMGIQPANA